jgi:hypothetical protein
MIRHRRLDDRRPVPADPLDIACQKLRRLLHH